MIRSFSLYFVQDRGFLFYENTPSLFQALEGGALDGKRDQTESRACVPRWETGHDAM